MQIICEHPNIIINPSLPTLISKYKVVHLGSEVIRYHSTVRSFVHLNKRKYYEVMQFVTPDNIIDYFVLDEFTGETFPVFLQVPCGHCVLCKNRKINSFVQRCRLESQLYDNKPWFVTLTYNENSLPRDGVSVRDAQLFMKRFRVNLSRHGFFRKIRYCLCAEYGKHTHRAHYHAIIWNLVPNTFLDYDSIVQLLTDSWQLGFVQCRVVDPSDDRTFYYTAKYLRKDCVVPEGCKPTFMLASKKNGGIGSPFLANIANRIRNTLNHEFQYLDKWTNKPVNLRFDSYILSKVFPSYCSTLSPSFRSNAIKFIYYYDCWHVINPDLTFLFDKTKCYVDSVLNSGFVFKPFCSGVLRSEDLADSSRTYGRLLKLQQQIERDSLSFNDFEKTCRQAEENQRKRDLFIGKCFRYMQPVDLQQLGYSVRNRFSRSKSLEQL